VPESTSSRSVGPAVVWAFTRRRRTPTAMFSQWGMLELALALAPPLRSTSDVDLDPTPACYPPAMAGTRVPSKATLSMPSRQPTPCRWPRPTTSNGSSSPSSMAQHTLPCARHAWRHPRAHPSRGTASSATSAMPITMRPPPRVSRASCVMHPSRARHGLQGRPWGRPSA